MAILFAVAFFSFAVGCVRAYLQMEREWNDD